jgi:hypothetical protein
MDCLPSGACPQQDIESKMQEFAVPAKSIRKRAFVEEGPRGSSPSIAPVRLGGSTGRIGVRTGNAAFDLSRAWTLGALVSAGYGARLP